ncbi:hypothetical protein Tco_0993995 [Tanacetum coccineum]
MAPLPATDQRHLWLRYQIEEYNEGIRHRIDPQDEAGSGNKIKDGVFWRGASGVREMSDTEIRLDVADCSVLQLGVLGRRIGIKTVYLGVWGYTRSRRWQRLGLEPTRMARLGPLPLSYVLIRDPVRTYEHDGFAYSNFCMREGRKSGGKLSGGHFIGCLAHAFWAVSADGIRRVVGTREAEAAAGGADEADSRDED